LPLGRIDRRYHPAVSGLVRSHRPGVYSSS
jgi:hypothetical protein